VATRNVIAADLLQSAALALACANERSVAAGAPAMLREFVLDLNLTAGVAVTPCGLVLSRVQTPSLQQNALMGRGGSNIRLSVTVIAAPALTPVPLERGKPCVQPDPRA